MKLFILLLAIYSLIFYQQYKIERSRYSLPALKEVRRPAVRDVDNFDNANFIIRNHYPGYMYSSNQGYPIKKLFLYE